MSGGNLVLVPLLYADGTAFKGPNGGVLVEVVAAALPAGAATAANQVLELAQLQAIDTLLAGGIVVTGPLTNTQLRASPVPVTDAAAEASLTTIAASVALLGTQATAADADANLRSIRESLNVLALQSILDAEELLCLT